jgi:hypothetical protein
MARQVNPLPRAFAGRPLEQLSDAAAQSLRQRLGYRYRPAGDLLLALSLFRCRHHQARLALAGVHEIRLDVLSLQAEQLTWPGPGYSGEFN